MGSPGSPVSCLLISSYFISLIELDVICSWAYPSAILCQTLATASAQHANIKMRWDCPSSTPLPPPLPPEPLTGMLEDGQTGRTGTSPPAQPPHQHGPHRGCGQVWSWSDSSPAPMAALTCSCGSTFSRAPPETPRTLENKGERGAPELTQALARASTVMGTSRELQPSPSSLRQPPPRRRPRRGVGGC